MGIRYRSRLGHQVVNGRCKRPNGCYAFCEWKVEIHGPLMFPTQTVYTIRILLLAFVAAFWSIDGRANVQPTNETRVVSPSPQVEDFFGDTVMIDDAGYTIIAGIPNRAHEGAPYAGVAEIFAYNGSNWNWQATLSDVTQSNAYFGFSTAIREDGNRVVVGAPEEDGDGGESQEDMGAAYLYKRNTNTWELIQRLQGQDTQPYDYFGESVGISENTIVVGADLAEVGSGVYPGAAYVFIGPTGGLVTEQAKLFADDGASYDYFGYSVAIQGDTIVVGAPRAADDEGTANSGAVYVFERTGSAWMQTAKITPDDPLSTYFFGDFLALDGDTIAVGNYRQGVADPNDQAGVVDVYIRDGINWMKQTRLEASDLQPWAWFGFGIDVSGDVIVVGAPYASSDPDIIENIGYTYLFQREGTNWTECAKFNPSGVEYEDLSGWDVSLCSNRVVTVSNNEEVDGYWGAGAMYVYDLVYNGVTFSPSLITWIAPTNTDDIAMAFTTEVGASYRVDYRDSLTAGDWLELSNNIPGTGGEESIIDVGSSSVTSRFYQVVIP